MIQGSCQSMSNGPGLSGQAPPGDGGCHIKLSTRRRGGQGCQDQLSIRRSIEIITKVLPIDDDQSNSGLDPYSSGGRLSPSSSIGSSPFINDRLTNRRFGRFHPSFLFGIPFILNRLDLFGQFSLFVSPILCGGCRRFHSSIIRCSSKPVIIPATTTSRIVVVVPSPVAVICFHGRIISNLQGYIVSSPGSSTVRGNIHGRRWPSKGNKG